MGGNRVSEEGEGGGTRSMYFMYVYENRTIKLVEIILSRGEGGKRE
jgi:hypothetical protein